MEVASSPPPAEVADGEVTLFNPATVPIIRYHYRGTRIATPWTGLTDEDAA
jgi:hypothetical protein